MQLIIANKLYSSWSLRPWLAMTVLGIPFKEELIPFEDPRFKPRINELGSPGQMPVLVDGDIAVWESIAIIEHVAERFPDAGFWPSDAAARANARAISSEMHAGFRALRGACPMNLGKRFHRRDRGPDVAADVARITQLWAGARRKFGAASGEPFLYGRFCAADAMFAPVVSRLDTYDIDVDIETRAYMDAILTLPAFVAWREAALKENWIFAEDEADELAKENLRPHLT